MRGESLAWKSEKKDGSVELAADSQIKVEFFSAAKMRSTPPALKDKVKVVQHLHG